MDEACPLCGAVERRDLLAANEHVVAIPDAYPLNPGHALIVSRRHVADLFDLSADEQAALWALLPIVKGTLDEQYAPAGYNVGLNVGTAAGQTVGHVHVHVAVDHLAIIRFFDGIRHSLRGHRCANVPGCAEGCGDQIRSRAGPRTVLDGHQFRGWRQGLQPVPD